MPKKLIKVNTLWVTIHKAEIIGVVFVKKCDVIDARNVAVGCMRSRWVWPWQWVLAPEIAGVPRLGVVLDAYHRVSV